MSNFYTMQQMAFVEIDKRLKTGLDNLKDDEDGVNIDQLILEITKLFPVSPKAVMKRVELYVAANKDTLRLMEREVILR